MIDTIGYDTVVLISHALRAFPRLVFPAKNQYLIIRRAFYLDLNLGQVFFYEAALPYLVFVHDEFN